MVSKEVFILCWVVGVRKWVRRSRYEEARRRLERGSGGSIAKIIRDQIGRNCRNMGYTARPMCHEGRCRCIPDLIRQVKVFRDFIQLYQGL
jgi:hypothetical protein